MALNSQQEDTYKRIAATLAQRRTPAAGSNLSDVIASSPVPQVKSSAPEQRKTDWSLGQSIIDVLSTGTYATAGIGRKIGENVQAIGRGEIGGALDLANPFSLLGGAASGITDRRVWSENLRDWGVEEGGTGGVGPFQMSQRDGIGLALDIALDPLWLIPGGAIAAGIKGVSRGAATASAVNKAGSKLTPQVIDTALKTRGAIQTGGDALRIKPEIAEMMPQTGQRIPIYSTDGLSNLIQGVKYGTADEYAKWGTARAERKAAKVARREARNEPTLLPNDIADQAPAGIMSTLVKPLDEINPGTPTGEAVAKKIEEGLAQKDAVRVIPDAAKDADINPATLIDAVEAKQVRQIAREQVEPAKIAYMERKGIKEPRVDFDAVDVSPLAGKIADEYEAAVSIPNDPEVIRAYDALKAEVREQYDYMTNELGIRVEFSDVDPYNILKDGKEIPSPKEMMRDVSENKRLVVRDSAPDYATYGAHPILSVEDNNMFRAVHDFFGHAGSGRGFLADGEEAAWISHSQMFSPLARRAMTTETRGQNSWFNKFGKGKGDDGTDRFAEQKAFLLPDQYVFTPAEFSRFGDKLGNTNTFGAVKTESLMEFADRLLPDLGMVWAPIKNSKMYSADEVKLMRSKLDEIAQAERFAPNSPEVAGVATLLGKLQEYLATPSRYASVTRNDLDGSIVDILNLAEDAFAASAKTQDVDARSLAMLRQLLDEPVDATDLLESALRMENRVVSDPKPFKPTVWAAGDTYGKPAFSEEKFLRYFANDELALDGEALAVAFGKVTAKPNTKKAKELEMRQAVLWDQFRARNHDNLAEVVEREKNEWFTANSIENSSLFTQMADGTIIGQGMLPTSIPVGTLFTHNGRVTTSIAALLDNLGKVINRTGPQMGGLPTSRLLGEAGVATRGEDILLQDGARIGAREVAGSVSAPERKKIVAAIRKRGREIELDSYPLATQAWLLSKLDDLTATIKKSGAKDVRLLNDADNVESVVTRLWDELPFLKSRADARKLATMGPEAVAMLAKAPARRYFVDAEFDRLIGAPDAASIGRQASMSGKRTEQQIVARDPETGVPIDSTGRPVPESDAAPVGGTQFRVLTDQGKPYTGRLTGRSGSEFAPQLGSGPQQLAALQAVRSALGSITENMGVGTRITPEQSQLLSSVMNSMAIRVAPNATPTKIFQQFQREALPRFESIVEQIESAAKIESVAYHAKSIFRVADEQSISLMKAIEEFDAGELQRQTVKFTDDALALVDDTCRIGTGRATPRGGQSILDEVLGGLGG